jgi:uncharacterized protein
MQGMPSAFAFAKHQVFLKVAFCFYKFYFYFCKKAKAMKILSRKATHSILEAIKTHPVVFLSGPRQAGKSTLAHKLSQKEFPSEYVTFDHATQLAAATSAPVEFLSSRDQSLIIDEAQLAPEIFRPLKGVVDELRLKKKRKANGQFLLTGSANIMALPKLSDPLVGRMSVITLYPYAACEVYGGPGHFIEALFKGEFRDCKPKKKSLIEAIRAATFPEISGRPDNECSTWFDSYLTTILQRDVRTLAEIEKISQLPTLLRVLASRSGGLLNDADISREAGFNAVTGKTYRSILKAMFLTFDVPPWYRNISKRLVKSPKGYLTDTLLLCYLLDWNLEELQRKRPHLFGHVVENFVATELTKLLSFSGVRAQLLHFRTSDGKEVDFILERPDGTLAAIEVKTRHSVDPSDFKGINELEKHVGESLVTGVVLYSGKDLVLFGKNRFAVPISYLWA